MLAFITYFLDDVSSLWGQQHVTHVHALRTQYVLWGVPQQWYRIYSSLFTRYSDLVVRLLRPTSPPTDTATPTLLLRWCDGIDS